MEDKLMIRLNNKGFSLLELVMVVVMIGILTSIGLPKYRRAVDRARVGEALSLMRSIYDSCERYAWEHPADGNRACWAVVAAPNGATFENLDIVVKGQFVADSGKKKLQTKKKSKRNPKLIRKECSFRLTSPVGKT